MKNQIYQETQAFSKKWSFVILAVLIFLIAGYILQTQYHITIGNKQMSNQAYLTCVAVVLLITLLIYFARLKTRIDEHGISYKFSPFQFTFKTLAWADLEKAYVRSYSPLGEYGGWGYRINSTGTAITVTGANGIQIVTKTGKNLLLGTCNPEQASEAISSFFIQDKKQ